MIHTLEPLLHIDEDNVYTEFAARFHTLITQTHQLPYAISIDGLWGTGKTAIMRALHEKLDNADYPVFWFNPWKYRQTNSVVLAFLQSLYLKAADKEFLPAMNKNGATIVRVLLQSGLDAGLKIITKDTLCWKDMVTPFTAIEDNNGFPFHSYQCAIRTIEQEFAALILAISKHHNYKPVVIFVDDLDRCLPCDMMHFLEALRILFATRNCRTIFVCGLDTQIVKQFISDHYSGLGENFAVNYLRKIFKITFSMPYSSTIKNALLHYIKTLDGWDYHEDDKAELLAKMIYTRGLQTQISSVRKYLNLVTNFHSFTRCYPYYIFQPHNDFIMNLLILREAWEPLYKRLIREAQNDHANMEQLVQSLTEKENLLESQEKFLTVYFGKDAPFAKEQLSAWLAKHPTLAQSYL